MRTLLPRAGLHQLLVDDGLMLHLDLCLAAAQTGGAPRQLLPKPLHRLAQHVARLRLLLLRAGLALPRPPRTRADRFVGVG